MGELQQLNEEIEKNEKILIDDIIEQIEDVKSTILALKNIINNNEKKINISLNDFYNKSD